MPSIHFIERLRNITRLTGTKDEYESGYWVVSAETAEKLVGADIYLHEGQAKPSYFVISDEVQQAHVVSQ